MQPGVASVDEADGPSLAHPQSLSMCVLGTVECNLVWLALLRRRLIGSCQAVSAFDLKAMREREREGA